MKKRFIDYLIRIKFKEFLSKNWIMLCVFIVLVVVIAYIGNRETKNFSPEDNYNFIKNEVDDYQYGKKIPDNIKPSIDSTETSEENRVAVGELVVMMPMEENSNKILVEVVQKLGFEIIGSIKDLGVYQVKTPAKNFEELEKHQHQLESKLPEESTVTPNFMATPESGIFGFGKNRINESIERESHLIEQGYWLGMTGVTNSWGDLLKNDGKHKGSKNTVIAVIDSGINLNHEDLVRNKKKQIGDTAGDISKKTIWHGTHVAGIIAAEAFNEMGTAGACPNCSLLGIDFSDSETFDDHVTKSWYKDVSSLMALDAMKIAVDEKAKVVNMSLQWIDNNRCDKKPTQKTLKETNQNNQILSRAILYQQKLKREMLWIFAAGNECRDAKYASPASLTLEFPLNTLAVASLDSNGNFSKSFSNFGLAVSIAAPGESIKSTTGKNDYKEASGTSMASPIVSGIAGLVWSEHPSYSASQVKKCILSSASNPTAMLNNATGEGVVGRVPGHSFGMVNAYEAVKCKKELSLPKKVDVMFLVDNSESMEEEIHEVGLQIKAVVKDLESKYSKKTDFHFGLSYVSDTPSTIDFSVCNSSKYKAESSSRVIDYLEPYKLVVSLSKDSEFKISDSLDSVNVSGNFDYPESYSRALWELTRQDYANPNWREGVLKLIVSFVDDLPHDTNVNDGIDSTSNLLKDSDKGIDVGRDGKLCTSDDLDFQDNVITELQKNQIKLFVITSSEHAEHLTYWQYWSSKTGGSAMGIYPNGDLPQGLNLSETIADMLRNIEK